VLRDIEALDCSPEFRKPNFGLSYYYNDKSSNPDKKYKKYEITKDGFTFLVMGYTGKKAAKFKEDYIAKFNSMERALISLASPPLLPDFNDPVAAARTWADAKEAELKAKQNLLEAQPKIEFYDQVGDSSGNLALNETSKILGTGRTRLSNRLKELGIFLKDRPIPYQNYIERGYFEVKTTTANEHIQKQTFVTPKGLQWLQKKYF
jgi:anti-repressor protein